ncbi:MAG: hypothetical protein GY754_40425 [bacterium]|nr:hypothetical protein [bacterium]
MNQRLIFFSSVFITLIFFLVTCSTGDSYIKKDIDFAAFKDIGILVKPGPGLSETDASAIATELVGIELSKKGYRVIEQFYKKELIREQSLSMSGLYQGDPLELGKLKSVKALAIVSFPAYRILRSHQNSSDVRILGSGVRFGGKDILQTEVAVSVRVISVATGDVLYLGTADRKLKGSRLREAARHSIKVSLGDLPQL